MIIERLERRGFGVICVDDALSHARLPDPSEELLDVQRMCVTAVLELEEHAQLALLTQAVRVTLPCWQDGGRFKLPIGPVLTPEAITLFSIGGAEIEAFTVTTGLRSDLRLTGSPPPGQVVIEYLAGFGESAAHVPEDIQLALLDQVATYYDARGAADGKLLPLSPHFARIAARYRGVRA